MKAYKAEELRAFTGALFRSERFDAFLLCEASFRTAFSLEIDGRRNKDWYSAEEEQELGAEDFVRWGEVRELAFQAIRGKKAPKAFRLVLRLNRQESTAFLAESGSRLRPEEVSGFYVTAFPGDKALEQLWDQATVARLRAMGLVISEL